jgi:NTE family protein
VSKITLSLSGGASRGAYHLGVLHFIEQNGIEVEAVSATSIGAVIAASWLSGVSAKEQLAIFHSKAFRKIFSFGYLKGSFLKIDYTAPVINELVPKDRLEELSIPLYITAVDLANGENIYFCEGELKTLCFAACALVPLFAPVEYLGRKLADGGIYDHIPTEPLFQYTAKRVGINLHPVIQEKIRQNFFKNMKRAMHMSMYRRSLSANKDFDLYITSERLLDYSIFSMRHLDTLFALGYEDAKQKFREQI